MAVVVAAAAAAAAADTALVAVEAPAVAPVQADVAARKIVGIADVTAVVVPAGVAAKAMTVRRFAADAADVDIFWFMKGC